MPSRPARLALTGAASAATGGRDPIDILVVGDSFSAGNGATDDQGVEQTYGPDGCRRSRVNWSEKYAAALRVGGQPVRLSPGPTVPGAAFPGPRTRGPLTSSRRAAGAATAGGPAVGAATASWRAAGAGTREAGTSQSRVAPPSPPGLAALSSDDRRCGGRHCAPVSRSQTSAQRHPNSPRSIRPGGHAGGLDARADVVGERR